MLDAGIVPEPAGVHESVRTNSWRAILDLAARLGEALDRVGARRVDVPVHTGTEAVIAVLAARTRPVELVISGPHVPRSAVDQLAPDHTLEPGFHDGDPRLDARGQPKVRGSGVWLFSSGTTGQPTATHWAWDILARGTPWPSTTHDDRPGQAWAIGYAPFGFAGMAATCQALGVARWLEFAGPRDLARTTDIPDALDVAAGTPSFWRMASLAVGVGAEARIIHTATVGGEPVDETVLSTIRSAIRPTRIKQIFGTTEAGTIATVDDGRPGLPVTLVGTRLSSGAAFEVRGEELLVSTSPNDPYAPTGDIVTIRDERVLVVGRIGSRVNVGGYKVDPLLVSQVLQEHPMVLAARAYGLVNPVVGNVIAADVVLQPKASEQPDPVRELKRFAASRLERFQVPKRIRLVHELRLAPSGKAATDE